MVEAVVVISRATTITWVNKTWPNHTTTTKRSFMVVVIREFLQKRWWGKCRIWQSRITKTRINSTARETEASTNPSKKVNQNYKTALINSMEWTQGRKAVVPINIKKTVL